MRKIVGGYFNSKLYYRNSAALQDPQTVKQTPHLGTGVGYLNGKSAVSEAGYWANYPNPSAVPKISLLISFSSSFFSFLCSTLETTFDTTVTTEVNGRGLPALSSRSSPMSWRLGQGSTPRLQAGDAPSYAPPRSSAGTTGRYGDPSRLLYTAPLRRAAASGARGTEPGEKGGVSEAGPEVDVTGYGSDGDILAKNVHADDISG